MTMTMPVRLSKKSAPDWILYLPLHLIYVLLTWTESVPFKIKHDSILKLYQYMIINCFDSSQLPAMYQIRIYVNKEGKYQHAFDAKYYGCIFNKIPSKQVIYDHLIRGIQPFYLCCRVCENKFFIDNNNNITEKRITLKEMKEISGHDFELFFDLIYIYALIQEFMEIKNDIKQILREFDSIYNVIDDIWDYILLFMYQDVVEYYRLDMIELKKLIIFKIPRQIGVFENKNDCQYWLNHVLKDQYFLNQIDTKTLIKSWKVLMDKTLFKSVYKMTEIIIKKKILLKLLKVMYLILILLINVVI